MREIKFRGKAKTPIEELDIYAIPHRNGWVYGTYVHNNGYPIIISHNVAERVDPKSVGQFTGVYDKNGKEIYEGDIVVVNLKFFDIKNEICNVIFKDGRFGIQYGFCDEYFKSFDAWDDYEVIGNVYENPDLLRWEICY